MKEELIKYVMEKADKCYSDDFPINNIEDWIREFFDQNQPERSKREDLKKCVICECERPIKEISNGVCCDCSEDSTFADSF